MGKMPNWFILRAKTTKTVDFARKNYQTGMIPMGKLPDWFDSQPLYLIGVSIVDLDHLPLRERTITNL